MGRLRERLSGIADAIWGAREDQEPRGRSALPCFLGVTIAVAVLLVLRRPEGVTNAQFWAEDGSAFFQQNLQRGCWHALRTFFRGFPYLEQKLVACAATPVPFVAVPLVYHLVAYVIAAASLASFSVPAFRHVVRSDPGRIIFCLAVAAMPHAKPLVSSLTNTAWYLGIWLMLLTIAQLPRSPLALASLSAAALLATFSAPLAVLTAPLWVARTLYAVRTRRLRDASFALVALAGVLAVIVLTRDLGRDRAPVLSLAWPLLNVVSTHVLADAAWGPPRNQGLGTRLGPGVVYTTALAMLLVLATLAGRGRWRSLPLLLYCAYGIVASSALPLAGHPQLAGMASSVSSLLTSETWFGERYHVLAVSMVYLAFLAAADRLPAGQRALTVALLLTWLVATQAPTFVLPPLHDLQWAEHAAALERKYADRSPEPVLIPVNPDRSGFFFNIALDRRSIAPEVSVPPAAILGGLHDRATLEQSFVARCPNLSEIDLWFGREGAATQTVHVELREVDTGRVAASFVRAAADLAVLPPDLASRTAALQEGARMRGAEISKQAAERFAKVDQVYAQALYFAPIPDSHGKEYVISATASGGTPGSEIGLYGSTSDTYPDGRATHDGEALPGDVAFRYGCSSQ